MAWKIVCPRPECGKRFKRLERLKGHMADRHGGYTEEEIASVVSRIGSTAEAVPENGEFQLRPPGEHQDGNGDGAATDIPETQGEPRRPTEPRRSTRRNRELNDSLNQALVLCVRHLTGEITPEEKAQLAEKQKGLLLALCGVEFDFDATVVKFQSRIWLVLAVAFTFLVPRLPSFSDIIKNAREAKKEKK